MRNKQIRKISLAALFVALAFILKTYLSIQVGTSMRISLFPIPLIIAGYILGPGYGLMAGLATDVLYSIVLGYTPSLYSVPTILWGFAGSLIPMLPGKRDVWKYAIIIGITTVLETFINSVANYTFGLDVWGTLPWRVLTMIIRFPFLVIASKMIVKQFMILSDGDPLKT